MIDSPPLASPGKTITGKHKILSELGRGGMGVVYKVKDTRLNRTVALKFLLAELTKDKAAKRRLFQEAQAAAALNQPQIYTIYEGDEADGGSPPKNCTSQKVNFLATTNGLLTLIIYCSINIQLRLQYIQKFTIQYFS